MHIYDKNTQIVKLIMGRKYKNGKIGKVYAWIQNKFVLNIILCSFCSTMQQETISWMKIERQNADIHFSRFAGMLPVIFGIFSPSSHFCQARQKQKLPIKMTGMMGPS